MIESVVQYRDHSGSTHRLTQRDIMPFSLYPVREGKARDKSGFASHLLNVLRVYMIIVKVLQGLNGIVQLRSSKG